MRPGKERGFLEYARQIPAYDQSDDRLKHWGEFLNDFDEEKMCDQGYRCMNCGVPFCMSGCPLGNIIPDFNDLVKDKNWKGALDRLHSTNNFPEFTGRVCPAPCEASCVLGITDPPVTIKLIERSIVDRGFEEGWITPNPPEHRTGKSVAVIGSGPAGLAAAQQLNRAGHTVTVYERDEEPGGLLVLGIPNFKMEKDLVRRRVKQMEAEGITFKCSQWVGRDVDPKDLSNENDAVLLTVGSTKARELPVDGHDLNGIHPAMAFLKQQNRRVSNTPLNEDSISAEGKNVVVLGGGDTGSDCLGTSLRQGAKHVWSFEIMPKPADVRTEDHPWPEWPFTLNVSSSHEEGGERDWNVLTKRFEGDENGNVKKLHGVHIEWVPVEGARPEMREIPGSEFEIECDLVLLALGFVHPEHDIPTQLGLDLDGRGNVQSEYGDYSTNVDGVYVAGDARRGQSLVVWALHEGREAARAIDLNLMGSSDLPSAHSYGYDAVSIEGSTSE
jgi:glutamate synthase (NADPH/NADH) small chain